MADSQISLEQGDNAIPRLRMAEIGHTGLNVSAGMIYEQYRKELRFPSSIKTFKEMSADATISAALKMYELMISRVKWRVNTVRNPTNTQKQHALFIEQCMNDMEQTWLSFIKEVVSVVTFGFSVHEIAYRRRRKINGSKYDDGLIGWKRLPIRSQDTIWKWVYSDDGRDLLGIEQRLSYGQYDVSRYSSDYYSSLTNTFIPIEKLLLFRTDVSKDNPEGRSPLISCFMPWKFRQQLEEIEAIGFSRNMSGVPHIGLHPKFMDANASDADKAVFEYCKKLVTNLHNNEQAGIVLPVMYDETGKPMFTFELLTVSNSNGQYIREAINAYDNKILTALASDVLKIGQNNVGANNLADSKTNLLAMAVEARLQEIADVLNNKLIPSLFKQNGWDDDVLPWFEYGELDDVDLEEFSKALQRTKATGLVAPTPKNINHVAEVLKLPDRVDENMSQEELNTLLGKPTSRSGDGMITGTGNGTSTDVASSDTSSMNMENKA